MKQIEKESTEIALKKKGVVKDICPDKSTPYTDIEPKAKTETELV